VALVKLVVHVVVFLPTFSKAVNITADLLSNRETTRETPEVSATLDVVRKGLGEIYFDIRVIHIKLESDFLSVFPGIQSLQKGTFQRGDKR
jgi:hypothetical protein